MSNAVALIMAAGAGDRFAAPMPKQLVLLYDRPLIAWSIERFASSDRIDGIIIVAPPGGEQSVRNSLAGHWIEQVDQVVSGGETRQHSVWNGLQALPEDTTHVLVHDAARPCLSETLLNRILDALQDTGAVVPAVGVVDTLIHERDHRVDAILDRRYVAGVQTPQAFARDSLMHAHGRARTKGLQTSDDGSLVLALGETVTTVPGERTNIKVTFPEDLVIAEAILKNGQ